MKSAGMDHRYTAGCYQNNYNDATLLIFNPYGVEGQCTPDVWDQGPNVGELHQCFQICRSEAIDINGRLPSNTLVLP